MSIVALALLVALCIPIVAILLDSPVGRAIGSRIEGRNSGQRDPGRSVAELENRLSLLEGDVEVLQHTVAQLRDENQFLQRLLEEGRLPPEGS